MEEWDNKNGWGHGPGAFFRMNGGQRLGRGDMSSIILRVLAHKPMHGYEIIRTLEERSHGFWRPSAGSIYPTLQLLEEQDLVTATEQDGKKVYSLTEKGTEEAKKTEEKTSDGHFGHRGWLHHHNTPEMRAMWGTFHTFVKVLRQVTFGQEPGKMEEAQKIMSEATEKLNKLIDEK